jgi:predicted ATPase/class 3 adenylate cyclase
MPALSINEGISSMSDGGRIDAPRAAAKAGPPMPSEAGEARYERRVLTALCYDLVGSTRLLGLLDIEDYEELIAAFQSVAKEAIVSCSGTVRVEAGDGGVALFKDNIDVKDAASLAIRAGLEIVEGCRQLGVERGRSDLHVRIGIATSMVLVQRAEREAAQDSVAGPAFAMATRLEALAQPDTVLVSDETRNLARRSHVFSFRGAHEVKGFAEPERVWRAVKHKREVDRFFAFGRLTSPLIDRIEQLDLIEACWRESVAGRGQVVLIEGEAGIGKSRILHEVRRRTRFERDKLVFFQCMPGDSRSTLHPLLQTMQGELGGEAGLTSATVARVFGDHDVHDVEVVDVFSFLLGAEGASVGLKEADPETVREKANRAARHALQAMCAAGPVVLVIEDIHWIDRTSRQLLGELAVLAPTCPALLIATTRPGHGDWLVPEGRRQIMLGPLDQADTRRAITAMWPQGKLSAAPEMIELAERVTGGVPLFIEEVCQWMADSTTRGMGRLRQGTKPGHASVFESVLEARLRPLTAARELAQAAAVGGTRFSKELLAVLLPELDAARMASALDALVEAGLVTRTRHAGVTAYAFRHALIQETIYNGTLRRRRQTLHRRLYTAASRNPSLAGWFTTAALAEQAERGGLVEEAIETLVAAGTESSSRSAMAEARQLLEHATALCEQVADRDRQDVLRLSAMAALGPVLTAMEGPNSPLARELYEDGVAIARRRPVAERARWFPIYWGWWFTDTVIDGERAQAVLSDLRDVQDAEVQLQARHCVWAIDFNLGHHEGCIAAVDDGLPLYASARERTTATLFGGHDARVCGLAHRGLSLWLTGRPTSALRSVLEARQWAEQDGHAASIAHACINEAMLHCYRRDFARLRAVVADLRQLTQRHHLPSLAVAAQIFEGWCDGHAGDVERGRDKMREGLGLHGAVQTPEDEPVYCGMLAELLVRSGELGDALTLLRSAVAQAEAGGSRFWLAELHRRSAQLLGLLDADRDEITAAFEQSLALADEQNAVPILISAFDALVASGVSAELTKRYLERVEAARRSVEPGEPLIVNPEPELRL